MLHGHRLRVKGVPPDASPATRCVVVACGGRTGAGVTTLVAALAADSAARGCPRVVPQPDLLFVNAMPLPSVWVQGWLPGYDALVVDAGSLDAAAAAWGTSVNFTVKDSDPTLLDAQKVVLVGCLANVCVYVCRDTVHRTDRDLLGVLGAVATWRSDELPRALGTLVLCLRSSRGGSPLDHLHQQLLCGVSSPVGGPLAAPTAFKLCPCMMHHPVTPWGYWQLAASLSGNTPFHAGDSCGERL
jgi:hypothetical protein